MKVYHLTLKERALVILDEGVLKPGKFCGLDNFSALFCCRDEVCSFYAADVVLGVFENSDRMVTLEIEFPDEMLWEDDPEAEYYGAWIMHRTEVPVPFISARIVRTGRSCYKEGLVH